MFATELFFLYQKIICLHFPHPQTPLSSHTIVSLDIVCHMDAGLESLKFNVSHEPRLHIFVALRHLGILGANLVHFFF